VDKIKISYGQQIIEFEKSFQSELDYKEYLSEIIGHQDTNAGNVSITVVRPVKIMPERTTNTVILTSTFKKLMR
jgi:hypothetical protein